MSGRTEGHPSAVRAIRDFNNPQCLSPGGKEIPSRIGSFTNGPSNSSSSRYKENDENEEEKDLTLPPDDMENGLDLPEHMTQTYDDKPN